MKGGYEHMNIFKFKNLLLIKCQCDKVIKSQKYLKTILLIDISSVLLWLLATLSLYSNVNSEKVIKSQKYLKTILLIDISSVLLWLLATLSLYSKYRRFYRSKKKKKKKNGGNTY